VDSVHLVLTALIWLHPLVMNLDQDKIQVSSGAARQKIYRCGLRSIAQLEKWRNGSY
jgi:hypothetical protein